ncbi:MAG TPA: LPS assembly lipoprotein LptE [Gammaproteobacteria bacterium]|nr:LPS assembly lipoprotein LptE [Gammaproteobacteria bacterium]
MSNLLLRLVCLASGLAILLSGCGFHLRGNAELPDVMQRTYLNVPSGNQTLLRELQRSLSSGSTSVVGDPTLSTATLNVLSAQQIQRVLSVSNIGRPLEKEVAYQVQFSLTTPKGTLIQPQTLTLKRTFAYDEANALGDAEQAQVLYDSLQRDMAQLILFRIEAIGRHSGATGVH